MRTERRACGFGRGGGDVGVVVIVVMARAARRGHFGADHIEQRARIRRRITADGAQIGGAALKADGYADMVRLTAQVYA